MVKPAEKRLIAQFYLSIDGSAAPAALLADLLVARIEGSVHLPDLAVLEFRNQDMQWTNPQQFKIGQELKIQLGEADLKNQVFVGEVTAIELDVTMAGTVEMRVRAYDRAHRLHRGRITKVFKDATDSDIATQIARSLGFQTSVESTSEVHEYVLQDNQTNWEFLQERAARLGFELQVSDKTLVFKPPPSAPADPIDLAWREELLSFRARTATGEQVTEVEVRGWDPIKKKEVTGSAKDAKGTPVIKDGRSGSDVAGSAFGRNTKVVVARQPVYSQEQAKQLAQTVLNELAGTFVTAEGVALGNPTLRLGSEVNLKSVGDQFTGKYVVTQIAHVYEHEGYRIEFEVTGRRSTDVVSLMAAPRAAAGMHVFTGIVTDNHDPDHKLGRVKVKLPWLGADVESHWCRLVSPGAGKNRGIEYLPEIDDEVLLVGSDVNNMYVLGGIWNQDDPPPLANSVAVNGSGQVVKRTIKSRTGHEITLDDTEGAGSITIVDRTGNNSIVIDTAKNNLDINVDGNITIKAKQKIELSAGLGLSMKSQTDASLSASTQLSLEGMATAKLSAPQLTLDGTANAKLSGATVSVSGGMVSIGA